MSEGIDAYIKKKFEVPDVDIRTYSPLTLAYIGDGVFDLVIRSVVVGKGNTRPNQLHHRTSQIVKAHTQAVIIQYAYGGRSGHLSQRTQCQVGNHGKKCNDGGLP